VNQKKNQMIKSLLLGGILPVVAFTLIEEWYGTLWGLVAGMVFGFGEILWEWKTQGKVDSFTWFGNGMLIVLGGLSLFTQEGIWFKMQPALLEFLMMGMLWGSVILNRPLFLIMAQKQGVFPKDFDQKMNPAIAELLKQSFRGLTLRLGVFFAIQGGLAVWAALYWSTAVWAALKGIGLTISLIAYLGLEILLLRTRIRAQIQSS
jgi:intracellular septation protein